MKFDSADGANFLSSSDFGFNVFPFDFDNTKILSCLDPGKMIVLNSNTLSSMISSNFACNDVSILTDGTMIIFYEEAAPLFGIIKYSFPTTIDWSLNFNFNIAITINEDFKIEGDTFIYWMT